MKQELNYFPGVRLRANRFHARRVLDRGWGTTGLHRRRWTGTTEGES